MSIRLSKVQGRVFRSPATGRVWISGRQSGKSYLAAVECVRAAVAKPRAKVWYIGPTFDQARDLAWEPLQAIIPEAWVAYRNASRLELGLKNGSSIALKSGDQPGRLRGPALDFLVLDEFAFMEPAVWEAAEPTTAYKKARVLFISTPTGYNWAYDLYLKAQSTPEWEAWQTTTADGGLVSPERMALARMTMDPRIYRQEYEASFETLKGRVYSNFARSEHVRGLEDVGGDLLVGMDFNVHPMSAVIAVQAGDECHVLDALELPISNTEEMAQEIARRYPGRRIIVCPDPSGRARKTSAPVGQTDFTILQRAGFQIDAPNAAPPVVDRINNVQALLRNANGRARLLVSPAALPLIKALDGLTYKEGTNLPDKSGGLDHITDALGYLVWARFKELAPQAATRPFEM